MDKATHQIFCRRIVEKGGLVVPAFDPAKVTIIISDVKKDETMTHERRLQSAIAACPDAAKLSIFLRDNSAVNCPVVHADWLRAVLTTKTLLSLEKYRIGTPPYDDQPLKNRRLSETKLDDDTDTEQGLTKAISSTAPAPSGMQAQISRSPSLPTASSRANLQFSAAMDSATDSDRSDSNMEASQAARDSVIAA